MNDKTPHWLTKQADLSPNKTAIDMQDGRTITFQELKVRSKAFAKKIASLDVQRYERIAILSNNGLNMVIAIHALSYLGAVGVLLNTKLTSHEIQSQLETANTRVVLTTKDIQHEKQLDFPSQWTFDEINQFHESPVPLQEEIMLSDPFTMMFTSGTTGAPKAVVHTYGNHWWSAIGSALNLGLKHNDKWLLTLPLFHVGGLSIVLKSVIYGMEIFLMEKYDVHNLFHAIQEKKVTIVSIVTMMLRELTQLLDKKELPELMRCLLLGGGSVPEPLLDLIEEKQLPVYTSYGLTETSSQIATLSVTYISKKIGSAGKALFPAQVIILEPNQDGIGEIAVKGPMVFEGYYQNDEANKKSFINGWFKTGDLGYIDTEGFLFVVERRTDLIISGGENIYPQEIENTLLRLGGVAEVAVVAKKDEKWGQVPVAFIVRQDQYITQDVVLHFLSSRMAKFKIPKEIHFISALPKNATNKVMRHSLRSKLK